MLTERMLVLGEVLRASGYLPLTQRRILDIGCGNGKVLSHFLQWGAKEENLYGIDLLADRVAVGKELFPAIHFEQANAEQLAFRDASFDFVLLFTVFTSILDDQMAQNVAAEVRRVLKAGGAVVWYDFRYNNPRNPHVRGMTRQTIRALFPTFELSLRSVTVLPPLAYSLGRATGALYPVLARVPLLRTHLVGLLRKGGMADQRESG
jgi:ubiquinone/menaquinone biosynthesis C-methylase UbiE